MGISSIVQIANRLLNGDSGQDSQAQGKNKITPASQAPKNPAEFGDRFTSSAQGDAANAAGGAGLFHVAQLRFTAANIQTTAGNNAAGSPVPAATAAAQQATTATPAVAATSSGAITLGATSAAPLQTQQDLQALNASLSALGLNAAEIAAFDQFAGVLLQFNPNALQDLQNQLNLLAARFQTQNATPAATPQTAAAPPNFQLTELSISFSGLNGTLTQGNPGNGNGTTTQFSAFQLQIQEVRVTLSNPAGETAQLQVPQGKPAGVVATATAAKSVGA